MGGEHDGAARGCVRVRPRRSSARRDARVHAARRLVEQEHIGAAHGDRRDRHPLALAAGQAARVAVGDGGEPERVEPPVDGAVVGPAEQPQGLLSSRRTVGANSSAFGSWGT